MQSAKDYYILQYRSALENFVNWTVTSLRRQLIYNVLILVDWYILQKALDKNVRQQINKLLMNHRKKLKILTRNKALPFTYNETVTNLSSHQLKREELKLLKNSLNFLIKPPKLNKANILSTFEKIHLSMKTKAKDEESYNHVKNELVHMAQCYMSSYRPTPADLKNYRILKNIRNNTNIIVLRPDKGNSVVIMDGIIYKNSCLNIINDQNRFKLLSDDPTQAKLQRLTP